MLRILHQSHVPDLIEIISKFGFEERNADGERLLEFCDAVELIVVNTCFKRQKNNLATYVSGSTVNTIDYLLLRRCERQIRKNIKIIAGEECVSQRRLLVGDASLIVYQGRKRDAHTKAESMEAESAQCKTRNCSVGSRENDNYENNVRTSCIQ